LKGLIIQPFFVFSRHELLDLQSKISENETPFEWKAI